MPSVPQQSALDILYEDDDLIVVNKSAGISVHPSQKEPSGTLTDVLLGRWPEIHSVGEDVLRPGIVHRLDKETSGILVVAKNASTFQELKELFKERKVEKQYLAIVEGRIKEPRGTITLPIGRYGMKRVIADGRQKTLNARDAKTVFIVRKRFSDATLLEVRPTTGRMHQIRVHLKAIDHPILGDTLYGGKRVAARAPRQMLHAFSLSFSRSDGRRFTFEADPPDDFQEMLQSLQDQD